MKNVLAGKCAEGHLHGARRQGRRRPLHDLFQHAVRAGLDAVEDAAAAALLHLAEQLVADQVEAAQAPPLGDVARRRQAVDQRPQPLAVHREVVVLEGDLVEAHAVEGLHLGDDVVDAAVGGLAVPELGDVTEGAAVRAAAGGHQVDPVVAQQVDAGRMREREAVEVLDARPGLGADDRVAVPIGDAAHRREVAVARRPAVHQLDHRVLALADDHHVEPREGAQQRLRQVGRPRSAEHHRHVRVALLEDAERQDHGGQEVDHAADRHHVPRVLQVGGQVVRVVGLLARRRAGSRGSRPRSRAPAGWRRCTGNRAACWSRLPVRRRAATGR